MLAKVINPPIMANLGFVNPCESLQYMSVDHPTRVKFRRIMLMSHYHQNRMKMIPVAFDNHLQIKGGCLLTLSRGCPYLDPQAPSM